MQYYYVQGVVVTSCVVVKGECFLSLYDSLVCATVYVSAVRSAFMKNRNSCNNASRT